MAEVGARPEHGAPWRRTPEFRQATLRAMRYFSQMSNTAVRRPDEAVGARDLTHWATPTGRLLERLGLRAGTRLGELGLVVTLGLIGAAVMGFFTWACAETYESVHDQSGLAVLDRPVLDAMLRLRSPGLDEVVTAFTTFGGPVITPVVASLVIGFLAWRWRTWLPVALIAIATAGSLAMTIAGKDHIGRVRPPHELAVPPYEWSPSFPSGHSLNSAVIGGVIAYLLLLHVSRQSTRVVIVLLAGLYTFLMGLSRIFLGHHWMTDVLVGWGLGAAWLAVIITVHRIAVTIRRQRRELAELEVGSDLAQG